MSLDYYLYEECDPEHSTCFNCGHEIVRTKIQVFERNITHNVGGIVAAAHDPAYYVLWRGEGRKAAEVAPILRIALNALEADPERFKQYEPSNKWGSVKSTIEFLRAVIEACEEHPDAVAEVSA